MAVFNEIPIVLFIIQSIVFWYAKDVLDAFQLTNLVVGELKLIPVNLVGKELKLSHQDCEQSLDQTFY